VIKKSSDLRSSTSDLIVKLLLVTCGSPIYHPREFQEFWRLPSPGLNYWHFRASGRCRLD
jgi:hypothetical protein